MFNSENITLRFANDEELRDNSENEPFARYLTEALSSSPHLADADVVGYRDYVHRNVPRLLNEEEEQNTDLPKCNDRAAKARKEGNRAYRLKMDDEYLLSTFAKYNESICWAQSDSEDIATGYANRSALCYEIQEYEFALTNIVLAKKHNCPERLLPKLQARELNCKAMIAADEHRNSEYLTLGLNVEVNPKIPFLAKGIAMEELPRFGRSMVAETDFKVGNVILCEKLLMASIKPMAKHLFCHCCSSSNFMSLLPCPQCASVMYCSEECLKKNWQLTHRFECGICDKIGSIPFDECHMAPKMFFYGLSLFNDDVNEMMKYCKSHSRTGSNPFDLDYTKDDPLAAFKVFHTAKAQPPNQLQQNVFRCVAAIWYTIYIQHPLVRSLFVGKAEQDFMLNCIFEYSTVLNRLVVARTDTHVNLLHTVASVCNHSCDPNTHAVFQNTGELKFVVIRPIREGEQICISYSYGTIPICEEKSNIERRQQLSRLEIDCACELCDPNSTTKRVTKSTTNFQKDWTKMHMVVSNETFSKADKVNAVKQFIQRHAYSDQVDLLRGTITSYRDGLAVLFRQEAILKERKEILASMNLI